LKASFTGSVMNPIKGIERLYAEPDIGNCSLVLALKGIESHERYPIKNSI